MAHRGVRYHARSFPSLPCGHDGVPDSPTGPITALCAELQGNRPRRAFGASTLLQLAAGKRKKSKAVCSCAKLQVGCLQGLQCSDYLSSAPFLLSKTATFGSV